MNIVPIHIKERVENAYYYLECADMFLHTNKIATHILLLLIAWENIIIAEDELHSWIYKKKIDSKLYKDHEFKFKKAASIQHIILATKGSLTRTIEYSTPKQLNQLRAYCQYGFSSGAKSVKKSFGSTWHADTFRNRLISKLQWTDGFVNAIEALK